MLTAVRQFNLTIWLVILSTFAGRFVLFMIWPFLAILLHRKFGLNEFEVGIFLALATAAGVVFGFYVGYLSDKLGRRKIMIAGLVLSIISMIVLGTADSLLMLFAGTLLQALARPMVEDPGRALMTDMVQDRDVKDMALHVRYFALNVGAATGPMLGAAAGLTGQQATFLLLGAVYGLYLAAAAIVFNIERPLQGSTMAANFSLGDVVRVLRRDNAFMLFVFAGLICSIAYGQIDAGLVQYLQQQSVVDIATLYAFLIGTNAATIVVFQFPLLKLTAGISPFLRAMIGVTLFAAGFLGFGLTPVEPPFALLVAMFILSLGEAILFPTMNIIIDRLAIPEMKGSYFGAFSFSVFGFALAPLVGGSLLYWFGGLVLWLLMTFFSVLVALLFFLADRFSERTV
ncbi:MFS transporter [Pelagibacterium halotolerans]|nr:MFS transporter [Pelagibacterium halotolerans]QJR17446.1 MFS transporter [Pelagibacterium halotolerans]SEA74341.1 Predicted arabinose efflux permease, MFS family [Pelagibacterium halotolerans]